jgi:hypothetical protein
MHCKCRWVPYCEINKLESLAGEDIGLCTIFWAFSERNVHG